MNFTRRREHRPASFFRRLLAPALGLAFTSVIAALAASCGSSSTGTPPCESVYADKCGGTCSSDFTCATGLYCGISGTCTADCASGAAQCPSGQECNVRGQCIPTGGGNGGSGGMGGTDFVTANSSTGSGPDACADVAVNFEKQIPTVMLLIDQSGSMTAAFGNGDRWNVLYDTLMDPTTGVVKKLEKDVRFGLALYTSAGGNAGGTCPMLVKVPLSLNNHGAIDAIYGPQTPEGDTPTGESLTAVTTDLVAYQEQGPKIIVLATDGEPDTCAEPNPQNGQEESIAAAQAAFGKNVRTFVIAVGSEVSQGHLQDVANAGAGLPIGGAEKAPFYQALDQQALLDAFDAIINGVRSCVLKLNGLVDETSAAQGKVLLDGMSLGYNDANGWKLNSPDEIELVGSACDTIKQGDHSISVQFPCGIVIPK